MEKFKVTKEIEFDYGHRVPFHKSKCFNCHGHRAKVQVTLEGKLVNIMGNNDFGMVMDFSKIKEILKIKIHDKFDHKFLLWTQDPLYEKIIDIPGTVEINFVPTAENLAKYCYTIIQEELHKCSFNGTITNVRFYETPTSYADYEGVQDNSEVFEEIRENILEDVTDIIEDRIDEKIQDEEDKILREELKQICLENDNSEFIKKDKLYHKIKG